MSGSTYVGSVGPGRSPRFQPRAGVVPGRERSHDRDRRVQRPGDAGDHAVLRAVDAAGGSGGFLLAYESKPFAENQDPFDIEVAKVGLDKTVSGKQLVTQTPSTEHTPAVAWNGNKWLVAWEDHRGANADIYGARIDANVNVLDPGGDPISTASGDQLAPAATANGTTFYVAWSDWRTGSTADVYGQRVTGLGRRLNGLGGFPISRQPATQQLPDLARLGSNVVAVWQDNRAGTWDVYGTRVEHDQSADVERVRDRELTQPAAGLSSRRGAVGSALARYIAWSARRMAVRTSSPGAGRATPTLPAGCQ